MKLTLGKLRIELKYLSGRGRKPGKMKRVVGGGYKGRGRPRKEDYVLRKA